MRVEVTGHLVGISSLIRPYASQDRSSDLTTKAFTHRDFPPTHAIVGPLTRETLGVRTGAMAPSSGGFVATVASTARGLGSFSGFLPASYLQYPAKVGVNSVAHGCGCPGVGHPSLGGGTISL